MDKSEMRLDPLTGAWTIFSAARALRPAFGSVAPDDPENAPPSPFLRGQERFAAHTLHEIAGSDGWQVRAVPNRAAALRVEGDATRHPDGFYDRMDGVGAHEVIVESPGHEALQDLPLAGVEKVIAMWKHRMLDLLRDARMRSISVIKNVGAPAGALVAHSVSQVVALAIVPPALKRKLELARAFYRVKKRSIFEDILCEEVRSGTRLVYENNGFAVFCPYAARAPFELAIFPKRQCADFHGLSDQELAQLADALRTALRKLCAALDHPPYNLMLHTAPTRTKRPDHWASIDADFRWHIEILPRLQHLGGLELATGCWVNSVWPEIAADYLRELHAGELEKFMTARQVFYEGKVQGVGFRYTVKRIANGYDVLGTVRNLPDGRVELLAAGEREEVEAFLTAIEESELKSHLRGVERHVVEAPAGLRGFQIVH